jgi:mono/diheme cytochrome c family protein
MMRGSIIVFIAFACPSAIGAFQPGEPFKPGKLPPAYVAALQQGLTLRFYKPGDPKALDARRVRLAALHVPKGGAPSPFIAPGLFAAKLSGYLKNPLKGDYGFRLVGAGDIVLKINDKIVLKHPQDKDKEVTVELAKNYNRLEIDFISPPGDATLRLYWSGEKFGFEPVPPEVLFSRGDDKDLLEQTTLREGRLLFANRQCASCHLPAKLATSDLKMPECKSSAPRLDDAGNRLQYDWLVAWIMDPRALRNETTMPRLLHGADAPQRAADIAAYLASVKSGPAPMPVNPGAKAADAGALAKRLGCSTCHRPDEPDKADELGRLSHFFTAAKYTPGALTLYLKEPHKNYAWTRMPDFKLTDTEAGLLETHVRKQSMGKIAAKPKGDAGRGEKLYVEVGCVRCHDQPGKAPAPLARVPLKSLDQGCLAAKENPKSPDFRLSDGQRIALTAFLKTDGASLTRDTPAEFAQRQVQSLQCAACHRRDGAMTRWHAVLEDEGKEPEKLPSLTWVGEKLKPEWTQKMLAGLHDQRARPWIKARMPAFPARAETLAAGLSHEHGFGVNEDERPKPDAKLAAIGEKLIPQQGGFNCNNCHDIGKTKAIQPFEAPGINLTDAAVRLRYAYYQRWMLAPDRVDVTMRMPVFAADGKTTQIREVFDGDARRQFDALWQYIQTLPAKNK